MPVSINGGAGETLKETIGRNGLDITANTVDWFWDEEGMNCHMTVDALLSYEDHPVDEE